MTFYRDNGYHNFYDLLDGKVPQAYENGFTVRFRPLQSNTGPSTIQLPGLPLVNVVAYDGNALTGGEIEGGVVTEATYNTLPQQFELGRVFVAPVPETEPAMPDIADVPVGAIIPSASQIVPGGYLSCHGQAVSRTSYAALFTAIGTVFGDGDKRTTFNVPDLRGEFLRGWDAGKGVDRERMFGTSQEDEVGRHQHELSNGVAHRRNAYRGGNAGNINGPHHAPFNAFTSFAGRQPHHRGRVLQQPRTACGHGPRCRGPALDL